MSGNDERLLINDYPICPRCKTPEAYWIVSDAMGRPITGFNPDSFLKARDRFDKVNTLHLYLYGKFSIDEIYNRIQKIECVSCHYTILKMDPIFLQYWIVAKHYLVKVKIP